MGIGAAVGGIASGLIGASSANRAARSQQNAANRDIEFQRETRDLIIDRVDPFYNSGTNALAAYNFNLGLGPRPTIGGQPMQVETFTSTGPGQSYTTGGSENQIERFKPGQTTTGYRVGGREFSTMEEAQAYANANPTGGTPYAGFQQSPGYQFQFDQGMAGVNAMAGARGGLNSGRTMQDLQARGQGLATQEWNNYQNRLAGLTDSGLSAAGLQANAASNAAAGTSNALSNRGNAQAAGAIGVGNAFTAGIGNTIGAINYQRGIASPFGTVAGSGGRNASSF
jgi:hypothetical protein